jgi:hypothetical protein
MAALADEYGAKAARAAGCQAGACGHPRPVGDLLR